MTKLPRQRVGGLTTNLDPAVKEWQDTAAKNRAAMSDKQKYDAKRVRVRVDIPQWMKDHLAARAEEHGTSVNQLAGFLLASGLMLLATTEEMKDNLQAAKRPSATPRVDFDLPLPQEIETYLRHGAI